MTDFEKVEETAEEKVEEKTGEGVEAALTEEGNAALSLHIDTSMGKDDGSGALDGDTAVVNVGTSPVGAVSATEQSPNLQEVTQADEAKQGSKINEDHPAFRSHGDNQLSSSGSAQG